MAMLFLRVCVRVYLSGCFGLVGRSLRLGIHGLVRCQQLWSNMFWFSLWIYDHDARPSARHTRNASNNNDDNHYNLVAVPRRRHRLAGSQLTHEIAHNVCGVRAMPCPSRARM